MSKLGKAFMGDDALRWSGFTAIICYIVAIIDSFASGMIQNGVYFLFAVILIISVIASFYKHEKKAMKDMVTALLTWNIMYQISALCTFIESNSAMRESVSLEKGASTMVSMVAANWIGAALELVSLVLLLIIFINHFVIAKDHHASTKKVSVNQTLLFILIIVWIVFLISLFILGFEYGLTFMGLGLILNFFLIISIETKINSYREFRDEAEKSGTWTAEKKAQAKKEFFGEEEEK